MKDFFIAARSNIGNVREVNQDNFLCNGVSKDSADQKESSCESIVPVEGRLLLAVFDGMGGLSSGEIAAEIAAATLKEECWIKGKSIEDGITSINKMICERNQQHGLKMGSTCVILENDGCRIRSWNVGDSRAYLLRHGELMLLSCDHKEEHHKHALTQYLGIDPEEFIIEPYVSEWIELNKNDFVLLCSDGLHGIVREDEIIDRIKTNRGVMKTVRELEVEALELGGKDNITTIGMRVSG